MSNARWNGQENFKPPSVDNSSPSSVHTLLKPVVVFIQDEAKWLFYTPGFHNVSMIVLKKSTTSLTVLSHRITRFCPLRSMSQEELV